MLGFNTVVLALVMATLGQVLLSVSLLLPRAQKHTAYWPLILFFIASGIMAAAPAVSALAPRWQSEAIALMAPAFFVQAPALWLYVQALTSPVPWRLTRGHFWHIPPLLLGLVTTAIIASLPSATQYALFITEQPTHSKHADLAAASVFFCLIIWAVQSGIYLQKIIRQLVQYRRLLKDLFASNERRELGWLTLLLFNIGAIWVISVATIFAGIFAIDIAGEHLLPSLYFVLIWLTATWGLRQKPGFEGRYLLPSSHLPPLSTPSHPASQSATPPSSDKYQRSALGAEQQTRIDQKLQCAMAKEQLYLDSALSLQKLAQHLAIPPNYVSQTLNGRIGQNFFDYINQWRVEHAKTLVLEQTKSITDIAYASGFNARSSFYKAFKRTTGQTPSEFRNANPR